LTIQLLEHAEALRREVTPRLTLKRKSALGQFMTPSPVARFMASLFPPTTLQTCRLLDAGAGVGALSCAFLDRFTSAGKLNLENAEVEAYEIDDTLRHRKHFSFNLSHI
jgi:adenine-specific DNA-methyltransferase